MRLIRTEGVGIARALAIGLEHTRAPLIARMDGDDFALPGRFGTLVASSNANRRNHLLTLA